MSHESTRNFTTNPQHLGDAMNGATATNMNIASRFGVTANHLLYGVRNGTARAAKTALVATLGFFGVSASAQDNAGAVFQSALDTSGADTILNRGMKVFGGFLVIGGIALTINGFTGRDEGYEKAVKIGIGVLTLALGMYFVTKGSEAFGIANMLK